LWYVLDAAPAPFGPAITLLLLTGQRRGEVLMPTVQDVVRTPPLDDTERPRQNGVAYLVPLSDQVLKI